MLHMHLVANLEGSYQELSIAKSTESKFVFSGMRMMSPASSNSAEELEGFWKALDSRFTIGPCHGMGP